MLMRIWMILRPSVVREVNITYGASLTIEFSSLRVGFRSTDSLT